MASTKRSLITRNKTFLPATKEDPERFEESFNGSMLFTGKIAVRNRRIGEIGISYMSGAYNKFEDEGLELDKKRLANVLAIDVNSTLPIKTTITGEWAWVNVDIPDSYTEQYGRKQQGGFVDIVQPILKRPVFGFRKSVFNAAMRLNMLTGTGIILNRLVIILRTMFLRSLVRSVGGLSRKPFFA
jgi:hypothetical protein